MSELEQIYSTHFDYVYMFMLRLTHNEALAEDMTADTFFKALSSLDSFSGKCDVRVWLCQIAKNCYISYLRKNKRITEIENIEAIEEPERNVEERILNSDEAQRIHKLVHEMAAPYKEVFTLRVFAELSFKQIAGLFGKTENWACVTYHRARAQILKALEEKK